MEADKEEQRGVVGFLNAERVRGREIYRRTSSCGWRKTPQRTSTPKLTRPGIEPGPAAWEVTMLSLYHSGGLLSTARIFPHAIFKIFVNSRKIFVYMVTHRTKTWVTGSVYNLKTFSRMCVCVCCNANPLHYYELRVPRKADKWRWDHITCGTSICIVYCRDMDEDNRLRNCNKWHLVVAAAN